jgi:hypothetical protein
VFIHPEALHVLQPGRVADPGCQRQPKIDQLSAIEN